MSAFVVSQETIGKALRPLVWPSLHEGLYGEPMATEDARQLGARMLALNVEAVRQRYGDDADVPDFNLRIDGCSLVQAYKALRCWLYQCNEGNVPDTELYQSMSRTADEWAHVIVSTSPAYDAAGWG